MKNIAIGFGGQFYTLWNFEVKRNYVQDSYGNYHCSSVDTKYYYIKNISKTEDKVKELYPDLSIQMDLKGTTSWTKSEKVDIAPELFWFGRAQYNKICEFSDVSYLRWYYSKCNHAQADLVLNRLIELGVVEFNGRLFDSQEEADAEKNRIESLKKQRSAKAKILWNYRNAGTIIAEWQEHEWKSSKVSGLYISIDGVDFANVINFENKKAMYYNGYSYSLPVDAKGNAKKIKGKRLECVVKSKCITDYESGYKSFVLSCSDFKIVK